MIVWTVNPQDAAVLELQWLDPGGEAYLFGVKLTRVEHSAQRRSGGLEQTIAWLLSDAAVEGLFADPHRKVVIAGFSPREEIARLAARAPIGEIVWTNTGMFRFWKRTSPLGSPGEWILKPGEPEVLAIVGESEAHMVEPEERHEEILSEWRDPRTGEIVQQVREHSYRGVPFYTGSALQPEGRGTLASLVAALRRIGK